MKFQSVIDKPERVRRVIPPITTILKTHALPPASHIVNARRVPGDRPAVSAAAVVVVAELIEEVAPLAATVLSPR